MPNKKKPKWGWGDAVTFTPYFYAGISSFYKSTPTKLRAKYFKPSFGDRPTTIEGLTDDGLNAFVKFKDDELKTIANVIGLSRLPEKYLNILHKAIENYLIDRNHILQKPRLSEIKAGLTEILERAKSLIEVLEKIDAITLDKMATASFPDQLDDLDYFYDLPFNKKTDAHRIYVAAKRALNDLEPDKGGRPPNIPIKKLIIELKTIYEKITGKKAGCTYNAPEGKYQGPFYDLVHRVLTFIEPDDIYTNVSLGMHIKKALSYSGKKSDAKL